MCSSLIVWFAYKCMGLDMRNASESMRSTIGAWWRGMFEISHSHLKYLPTSKNIGETMNHTQLCLSWARVDRVDCIKSRKASDSRRVKFAIKVSPARIGERGEGGDIHSFVSVCFTGAFGVVIVAAAFVGLALIGLWRSRLNAAVMVWNPSRRVKWTEIENSFN